MLLGPVPVKLGCWGGRKGVTAVAGPLAASRSRVSPFGALCSGLGASEGWPACCGTLGPGPVASEAVGGKLAVVLASAPRLWP